MPVVKTPAIVLQAFPYSETSRILRYLTPEHGVVSVIAKGIRRTGARSGGLPDLFCEGVATIHLKPSRELQTLREFALTRTRLGLAADLVRFGGAVVLTELVLRHAGEQSHPELFRRLHHGLDRLESALPQALVATVLTEAWGIVSLLGYEPQLDCCVSCGAAFSGGEIGRFDYYAGGIRCSRCATDMSGPRIGPSARNHLRQLVEGEAPLALPRAPTHLQLLGDFVKYHISGGRALRSLDFLMARLRG
ncbi:MAG: DNA repair protein RecO [Gemmatimonadetes bacterium]|nr:DNA repair protein RecO [Gemmatimonadota bacterium]